MTDYGHELRLGTFLTPQNADPQTPVELAVLTEQAGLDLVTFQDHPYQPSFLDTWTLLSWVAARTERVHLTGNVLNVPMRPPAVLARAAASLDLLSGGRVELGLGAGAFWDAIEAMGVPRLTPGQAVDALDEAIDVIRALWDTDGRGPLRTGGEHHHLAGAKRGPAPAHEIGIWVGAYKPRMLRLVGRKADGWLPSLGYLQPGDLARGNATIDEAATAAGRDPREIRRLLNVNGRFSPTPGDGLDGPPEQWVDTLVRYALEDGIGTFVLAADDPGTIRTFAEQVAPAVRDQVAAARASTGTATGAVRPAAALAKRVAGIDYDAVPADVPAVEPGDRAYASLRSTYMRRGAPGVSCSPARRPRSSTPSGTRSPRTDRSRCGPAATASPGGRPTTAVCCSTSARSTRSRSSTRRCGACGSAPGPPGARSLRRSPRTAGRSRPATTAAWASAGWRRRVASGCSGGRTA